MSALNISLELELEEGEPYRNRALQVLLWMLIHLNELYLEHHPETPRLYEAALRHGVRYIGEPYGYEQWISIPTILRQGGADCEDLCAWRVAELRRGGTPARPMWSHSPRIGPDGLPFKMYHIRVFVPGWGVEDPSKVLGMTKPNRPVLPYPAHWRQSR